MAVDAQAGWLPAHAARASGPRGCDAALEKLDLTRSRDEYPDNLPYGTRRRIEIARAIAPEPKLLMLDEPIAGMNREERAEIAEVMKSLRDDGLTQLLIEHDLRIVLNTCDHIFVMNFGKKVAEGPPHATAALPVVQEAYLGRKRCRRLRSRTWSSATARSRPCTASTCGSNEGQVATLLGSNGAGKTSTLNALSRRARAVRRDDHVRRCATSPASRRTRSRAPGSSRCPRGAGSSAR